MELFKNLLYEYKKGMRDLSLHTCPKTELPKYINLLNRFDTKYLLVPVTKDKFNIFFGNQNCLNILKKFSNKELNKISPYEDFILGIMLGYSRNEQYKRILGKI